MKIKTMLLRSRSNIISKIKVALLILICLIPGILFSQTDRAITGTVYDSAQSVFQDVSIIVKGSNRGTTSGSNGTYSIMAKNRDVLVFSYTGMETQEIPVGVKTILFYIGMQISEKQHG